MSSLFRLSLNLVSLLSISNEIKKESIRESFNTDSKIIPPKYNVSIVMPAYNEETLIEYSVKSIKNQNIIKKYPDMFELILVDSHCTDNTIRIARDYVNKIVSAPRGKLAARNSSIPYVDGQITVSIDADAYYPPNWLNTLLKSFNDKSVVAVTGFTLNELLHYPRFINKIQPLFQYVSAYTIYEDRLYGLNSAYYTDIQKLNPFNENIDQYKDRSMINEEEISFGRKMSMYGKVVFNRKALCLHLGTSKIECRLGHESKNPNDNKYCKEIKNRQRF